jgi:hypothetical protein
MQHWNRKDKEMIKDTDMFEGFGGRVKLWKITREGVKIFLGEYHNCITKAAKDAILMAFAQSALGTPLGASFYAQRLAFCSGVPPATPYNMALVTVEDYVLLDTPTPNIAVDSKGASVTLTATYTNPGGVGTVVTITYLAAVMADADPNASNVLSVIILTEPPYSEIPVAGGESLVAEYIVAYKYVSSI